MTDLIDNYHPDLLYSDGAVPFGNEAGLSMIAHLYNSDINHRRSRKWCTTASRSPKAAGWRTWSGA